ncbi:MAG: UDP-N-acetylglucosamine--N-acetylmuramyl-(pentapeptide) pyrophosphoryl-undecaprenol N-acetylglucosamine transferase [Acidimicrobiales bacterium]
MTAKPFAVIAGGGTGGHVFEALAIARALRALGHDPETIELVGSRRGQEATLLAGQGFPFALLPGRGIVRRLDAASLRANLGAVLALAWATAREMLDLARRRPRVVVSVGGYASFPADVAAVVLGVPLVLVTIDAVPGAVHRLLERRAAAHAVAFPETHVPRAVVTGVAVRQEIVEVDRGELAVRRARKELELPADRKVVGIVGGSLGARRLNVAALDLAERWRGRDDLALYHVTGWRDADFVRREASERASSAGDRGLSYHLVPFEDRMARLYEAVDVMVCRAGASTVAELAVAGVPSVLVPLPGAPGDHQHANARALAGAGAAVLMPDATLGTGADRLASLLEELLSDPARLQAMGEAARAFGRPDAAERIGQLVVTHAH